MHCYFVEGTESVPKIILYSSVEVDVISHTMS